MLLNFILPYFSLFPVFFSIFLSNLMDMKFCTNIEYELLYCVKENHQPYAYHSLSLSIFSVSPINFYVTEFSAPIRARLPSRKYTYISLTPLNPTFIYIKLGFTGVYIIFSYFCSKHRLWVFVRTASPRRF